MHKHSFTALCQFLVRVGKIEIVGSWEGVGVHLHISVKRNRIGNHSMCPLPFFLYTSEPQSSGLKNTGSPKILPTDLLRLRTVQKSIEVLEMSDICSHDISQAPHLSLSKYHASNPQLQKRPFSGVIVIRQKWCAESVKILHTSPRTSAETTPVSSLSSLHAATWGSSPSLTPPCTIPAPDHSYPLPQCFLLLPYLH